ncbi:MAG: hypothetical protein A2655_02470 [Candidatus Yanofskybacteria bacterium RIFCSPHIGHO2_01_FULL_43_42]|uniref:Uncharacterized protein n=1 Tax=Candidatus Yanofskybacteria bacterium RIFCSPLOWO2_01_FULL_43_22 TaxID=1802695 RepID=A0A1F8GFE5_9BACT|nr:MAG: hypothetical protein A2655_02470 [Candidatus Yanofskybacteria bacterium RIFCSPHIGHO2_01_FULL_43_42]OGN13395.1 MAG: hypothetical protein A3D48_00745 [Candidatus Yanofskybacteria bacterium RIFCSPHIGHO2_02_FULL_43_17]OGN23448.1 MAG: hypothetical protein A3A13_03485 [Candidatus Yanofskybacteria bacterium RIFCSPLOWO2_01_FULL_43_22]
MKSEVRALEQAVCGLVAKLDILLTAELGLRLLDASNGLHISTPDHLSEHRDDAFVTIRPVGWPNGSYISARFFWGSGKWKLYESGRIYANHLSIPVHGLIFEPSDDGVGVRFLVASYGYQRDLLANSYTQLIASLQQDAVTHQR